MKSIIIKPNQPRTDMTQPVSMKHIVTPIFKYKWLVIIFFFGIVGAVALGSLNNPKIYKASAKFIVEKELDSEKALLLQVPLPSAFEKYDWMNAELEILKSYPVAVRVVDELDLLKSRPGGSGKETKQNPEKSFEQVVKVFQRNTQIEITKNSNVIGISHDDPDPVLATRVVNTLINTYVAYRSELYDESETYKFFEEQMQIIDEKLRDLERHQTEFRRKNEMISPEAQRSIMLGRLENLEKRLTEVKTEGRRQSALLAIIKSQAANPDGVDLSALMSNEGASQPLELLTRLRNDLFEFELAREKLLQNFTPQSKKVEYVEKQIAVTKAKLAAEMRNIIDMMELSVGALANEENTLQQSIRNITAEAKDLAQEEYEYSQISRGVAENREIYSMLLKQREEARISLAKLQKGISIKVISPAVVPNHPESPRTLLKIALAVILGLVGGLGLAFFRKYLDHTFTFPEEVENYIGLPVLGLIREFDSTLLLPATTEKPEEKRALQKFRRSDTRDVWVR